MEKENSIRTLTDLPWGQESFVDILGSHKIRGLPIFVASEAESQCLLARQTLLNEAFATLRTQDGVLPKQLLLKEAQIDV